MEKLGVTLNGIVLGVKEDKSTWDGKERTNYTMMLLHGMDSIPVLLRSENDAQECRKIEQQNCLIDVYIVERKNKPGYYIQYVNHKLPTKK